MCSRWGFRCFPRGRVGRKELAGPQATDQACLGLEFLMATCGDSCTSRDVAEGAPTNQRTPRTGGVAQTCRTILHCRTGRRAPGRDLKSLASLGVNCCGTLQLCRTSENKFKNRLCSCTSTRDCACARTQSSGLQVSASENTSGRSSHK